MCVVGSERPPDRPCGPKGSSDIGKQSLSVPQNGSQTRITSERNCDTMKNKSLGSVAALALVLVFSVTALVGCGGKKEQSASASQTTTASQSASQSSTTAKKPASKKPAKKPAEKKDTANAQIVGTETPADKPDTAKADSKTDMANADSKPSSEQKTDAASQQSGNDGNTAKPAKTENKAPAA